MKTRRLNIKDDVRIRLQKIRESLAGVTLDDEEMSKILIGGCGGICYVTCSFYCESSCKESCMCSSTWIEGWGPDLWCIMLPSQNGTDWERIIYAR